MEPRVRNLLLSDAGGSRRRDNHQSITTSQRIALTSDISTPVDPQIDNSTDSRPISDRLRNQSKSWRGTVASENALPTPQTSASTSADDAMPSTTTTTTTTTTISRSRPTKSSAVPLAEVLNSNLSTPSPRIIAAAAVDAAEAMCAEQQQQQQQKQQQQGSNGELDSGRPRKSRRLEAAEATRTLPRPPSTYNREEARGESAKLPPILAPLHDPPQEPPGSLPSMASGQRFISSLAEAAHESLMGAAAAAVGAVGGTAGHGNGESLVVNGLEQDMTGMELERQEFGDEQGTGDQDGSRPGKKGKRSKWTAEETSYLIQGVGKFGIGSWKKILKHPDFQFKEGRNSIDLKDRFRTCFPDEYRKSGAQTGRVESTLDDSGKRRGRGSRTTVELAKMGVNGDMDFPKLERRQRKNFTKQEDDDLLRGFLKYPAQWKKIQSDPDLKLSHRTRTDLRDRFRNRFPQRFKEAGYKHKAKQGLSATPSGREQENNQELAKDATAVAASSSKYRPPKYGPSDDMELATLLIRHNNADRDVLASGSKDDSTYPLPLLTSGITEPYDPDFAHSPLSPEEEVSVTHLSREIFDWADRHGRPSNGASQHRYADPTTLTSFEAYHLNPLPVMGSVSNNPSTVPLSRILNAPNHDERQGEA